MKELKYLREIESMQNEVFVSVFMPNLLHNFPAYRYSENMYRNNYYIIVVCVTDI